MLRTIVASAPTTLKAITIESYPYSQLSANLTMTFQSTLDRIVYPWAMAWVAGAMLLIIACYSNDAILSETMTASICGGAGFLMANSIIMLTLTSHMTYREISTQQKAVTKRTSFVWVWECDVWKFVKVNKNKVDIYITNEYLFVRVFNGSNAYPWHINAYIWSCITARWYWGSLQTTAKSFIYTNPNRRPR